MDNFKSKKEWEAEADRLFAEGVSPQDINSRLGTYSGPEGTFTIQQAKSSKRGFTVVDKNKRKARNARRTNALKEQDQKLLDTLEKGGYTPEEALQVLDKEHASYKRIEDLAKKLNKVHGKGSFNAGHETAALEGGINSARNARLEIGKSRVKADGTVMRGNQSRGKIDEAPDNIKPVMGIPRSGRGGEDVGLQILLEEEFPDLMDTGLTPKDRQDIKRNPELADDIFQNRQNLLAELQDKPVSWRQRAAAAMGRVPLKGIGIGAVTGAVGGAKPSLADPSTVSKLIKGDTQGLAADAVAGAGLGGGIQATIQGLSAIGRVGLANAAGFIAGKVAPPAFFGAGIADQTFANPTVQKKYQEAEPGLPALGAAFSQFTPKTDKVEQTAPNRSQRNTLRRIQKDEEDR